MNENLDTLPFKAYSATLPDKGGVDVEFRSLKGAVIKTVKLNGMRGLWKGSTANLLKVQCNPSWKTTAMRPRKTRKS